MIKKIRIRLFNIITRLQKHQITRQNLHTPAWKYILTILKLEVIRKFRLKAQYKRTGLVSTNIETFSVCNRKCEFCFNHPRFEQRKQGKMPTEMWEKIMDQLAEIRFSGRIGPHFFNEPLLDERLPHLIEYARKKLPYAWIQINTNGDFLNEELLLKLYAKGVNYFFITNYDKAEKPLLKNLEIKFPALVSVVKNSDMWRTDRGGEIFHKKKLLDTSCLRPSSQIVINWEGKVLLCCMDYYARYSFGNLNDRTLFSIWWDKNFIVTREKIKQTRQKGFPICHNCDDPGIIPW